jgi:putative PIN family toxin of toxin-antitoxin system
MSPIVLDTSVFVAALLARGGANREMLRRCLQGDCVPLMGEGLYAEHEAVLAREGLFARCPLDRREREALFDAYLRACRWTRIYYLWRPNLRDESDNHLVELAVAGGAAAIVTRNVRDLGSAQLKFQGLRVLRPEDLIKEAKWER